jgi:hypothetical protein
LFYCLALSEVNGWRIESINEYINNGEDDEY